MILGHIYGGIDCDTREMRYVGKTTKAVGVRPLMHIKGSQKGDTHKDRWIRDRLSSGREIEWIVIEYHTADDSRSMKDLETGWIKYFREIGCRLTNGTLGGEGCDPLTSETKRRMSEAHIGKPRSLETRIKISLAQRGKKGKPHSMETKRKISETTRGRSKSDVTRAKIAAARTGTRRPALSAESKQKLSLALKGKNKGKIPWNKGLKLKVGAL